MSSAPTLPIPQTFALALQHHHAGRLAEAEAIYRQILAAEPNHAESLHHLGVIANHVGRHDLAVDLICQAIVLKPNDSGAHSNLANAYRLLGRLDESIAGCRRALQLDPDLPQLHSNLGAALADHGQLDEAVAAFQQALALKPDYAEGHYNLGNVLKKQGQFEETVACHRRAIDFRPDYADAHLNLGLLLLLLGHYEEGWQEYEWRLRTPAYAPQLRRFRVPQWTGKRVVGKTILVHAEQGLGDTLQLVRYLTLVSGLSRASLVILECQPALVPLLQQLQSLKIEIVARGASDEALPPYDLHLPMFSMPLALECFSPAAVSVPYLHADPQFRTQWRERLATGVGPRIGLAWAGDPAYEGDTLRSIAPEEFAPILRLPGIRFVSLQVEPHQPLPPAFAAAGVRDFTTDIANFSDTAALLVELDLIITVDAAVAHLAGALGRAVWLLLPFVPDWRWGLGRGDTPWYPTMRLFRQSAAGDWKEVMERVAATIRQRIAQIHNAPNYAQHPPVGRES